MCLCSTLPPASLSTLLQPAGLGAAALCQVAELLAQGAGVCQIHQPWLLAAQHGCGVLVLWSCKNCLNRCKNTKFFFFACKFDLFFAVRSSGNIRKRLQLPSPMWWQPGGGGVAVPAATSLPSSSFCGTLGSGCCARLAFPSQSFPLQATGGTVSWPHPAEAAAPSPPVTASLLVPSLPVLAEWPARSTLA